MPHNSTSGAPLRDSHSSIWVMAIVWPPTVHRVSVDNELEFDRSASIIAYIAGTPSNMVARYRSISRSAWPGSNFLISTTQPPAMKVELTTTFP
jgi:hypothetical protein